VDLADCALTAAVAPVALPGRDPDHPGFRVPSVRGRADFRSTDRKQREDAPGNRLNSPETALKVLKAFDPNVQSAAIDLAKTYTTKFIEAAQAGH